MQAPGERITKTEAERLVAELRRKAMARTGRDFPIIVIQEASLDGFRVHRVLQSEGIESHVVDAASILTSRRRRRAKTVPP
jgi:transposase